MGLPMGCTVLPMTALMWNVSWEFPWHLKWDFPCEISTSHGTSQEIRILPMGHTTSSHGTPCFPRDLHEGFLYGIQKKADGNTYGIPMDCTGDLVGDPVGFPAGSMRYPISTPMERSILSRGTRHRTSHEYSWDFPWDPMRKLIERLVIYV